MANSYKNDQQPVTIGTTQTSSTITTNHDDVLTDSVLTTVSDKMCITPQNMKPLVWDDRPLDKDIKTITNNVAIEGDIFASVKSILHELM